MQKKDFLFTFILILAVSCASVNNIPKLTIETVPANATVYSESGVLLGSTPLNLNQDQLKTIRKDNYVQVTIKKPGFQDKSALIQLDGPSEVTIPIEALSPIHFKEWVLGAYGAQSNQLIRELLEAQGLIISKRNSDAEDLLLSLENKYKNISAVYTLLAIVSLDKKDLNTSKSYLLRALAIDPGDSTAVRLMKKIEGIL